jgi:hypothetical protein
MNGSMKTPNKSSNIKTHRHVVGIQNAHKHDLNALVNPVLTHMYSEPKYKNEIAHRKSRFSYYGKSSGRFLY